MPIFKIHAFWTTLVALALLPLLTGSSRAEDELFEIDLGDGWYTKVQALGTCQTSSPTRLKATTTSHCAANDHTSEIVSSVVAGPDTYTIDFAIHPRHDNSTTHVFTTHLLTNSMDLGKGFSGGGYWYVSSGGGDFVVGVHSGFTTIIDWGSTTSGEFTGPKHDIFRSWVNSTI